MGQPTHALDSTQVNSECPTVQVRKERQLQTCMHLASEMSPHRNTMPTIFLLYIYIYIY